jgi:Cu-processing system permease protein
MVLVILGGARSWQCTQRFPNGGQETSPVSRMSVANGIIRSSPRLVQSPGGPAAADPFGFPGKLVRMEMIHGLIRLILLEALRVRLGWIIGISIGVAFGLAQFIDHVALVESRSIQASILAAALRFCSAFIVIMFVVTSMVRESNDKVAELLLSLPASRAQFLAGKMAGYVLVALLIGLAQAIPLSLIAPGKGLVLWTLSLMVELAIVAAASLFCVLSLAQSISAIAASTALYLLARSMGAMQMIAEAGVAHTPSIGDKVINLVVSGIALFVPALDRMTQASWLLDPPSVQTLINGTAQGLLYVVLLSAASLFDLYRRNF